VKIKRVEDLNREELLALLTSAAKNWLAHDGLWFRAVEAEKHGGNLPSVKPNGL